MSVEAKAGPPVYHARGAHSYFLDRIQAERGDNEARARLERHEREIDHELERRDQAAERELRAAQEPGGPLEGVEFRANPDRTAGQGGYFSPPLWLIDRFASQPRAKRVLAALTPNLPLPKGVQSVNVPRMTTGAVAGVTGDLEPVPGSSGITDTAVTSAVAPIAGQIDPSMQQLEQSPGGAHLDFVLFQDLRDAYDAALERQLVNGSGANYQLLGLLNVTSGTNGANAVTYTDASPTGPEQFPFVGQMAAKIGDNRNAPPEAWLMRTARWAWLATAEDTATQPIVPPGYFPVSTAPPSTPADKPNAVAPLLGWPIFPDDAIPATLGAAGNQDAILLCRPSDNVLLESDLRTTVNVEPLSGTLQARVQLRGYAAHLIRQPTGIATLTGTGMVVQSGY
jgi:HK97 family phage major capsid protein